MCTRSIYIFIIWTFFTFSSLVAQEKLAMTIQNLNVRKEPTLQSKVLGIIPKGENVILLENTSDDWSIIHYDILTGFVKTKYLMEVSNPKHFNEVSKTTPASIEETQAAVAKVERIKEDIKHKVAQAAIAHVEQEEQNKASEIKNTSKNISLETTEITSTIPDISTDTTSKSSMIVVSKVIESESEHYALWKKKSYKSGATPKSFNFKGKFDYKLDNYLKVDVGANTDVIVKLYKMGTTERTDECIRITYIKHNTSCFIKHIPEGNYYLKIAYGKDWREHTQNGKTLGTFTKNVSYQKGESIFSFYPIKKGKETHLPSYKLSLNVLDEDAKDQNKELDLISSETFYDF